MFNKKLNTMKKNIFLGIVILLLFSGCKKETTTNNPTNQTSNPPSSTNISISSSPLFIGEINGNTVRYDSSNAINTTGHNSEIGQDTCTHIYHSGLVDLTGTQSYIMVALGTLVLDISTTGCYPDAQTFLNLFHL